MYEAQACHDAESASNSQQGESMTTKATDFSAAVAAAVEAAMKSAGESELSLSNKTGIPCPTLRRRLQCVTSFTIDELDRIADALGVDMLDLIGQSRGDQVAS